MGGRGASADSFKQLEARWNAAAKPVADAAATAYKNPQRDFSIYTSALGEFEKFDGEVQKEAIKKYGKGLKVNYDDITKSTGIKISGDRSLRLKGGDAGSKSVVRTYLSEKDMRFKEPQYKAFDTYREAFAYAKRLNKE